MKCIYNAKIITNRKVIQDKAILFDDKIRAIIDPKECPQGVEMIDGKGNYISAGFIDMHIHGYKGNDIMSENTESIRQIANDLLENGVTSFVATTMTTEMERMANSLSCIEEVMKEGSKGAEVLGTYMEGPCLNKTFKGAHPEEYVTAIDSTFLELVNKYQQSIKIVMLAPELQGANQLIEKLTKDMGIVVTVGHSGATYDQMLEGIRSGASNVTHLFNAMKGLHHRDPGVVGAALMEDVSCEVICDGKHIHPALFKFILRNKRLEDVVVITDCANAGGLEEGEYVFADQKIYLKEDTIRLEDGTLAGSALRLNKAVRNLVEYAEITLEDAIECATINPAKAVGVAERKGSIEPGKDADLVIFNEDMAIQATVVNGEIRYKA